MPRENNRRGRRGEKRKREGDAQASPSRKRQRSAEVEIILDDQPTKLPPHYQDPAIAEDYANEDVKTVFFGTLDDDEQEIFKRAHALLNLSIGSGPDAFPDEEAKDLFLENLIWKEADGKELKLACSQSCSRLLEQVMGLASPAQLRRLFGKFRGNFSPLVQHRFASHCCETLFSRAAGLVGEEGGKDERRANADDGEEEGPSLEQCFIDVVEELAPDVGFLMTDVFASHVLRTLLVILSGRPLSQLSSASKKGDQREKLKNPQGSDAHRVVPASFTEALQRLTSGMSASLDNTALHILTTHTVGNPMLQLLLDLELTASGRRATKTANSIYSRLLPDDPSQEGSQSATFINHLLYDTVGSRLLEIIFQTAPDKTFRSLYKSSIQPRLKSIIRNDTANFVLLRCIERMGERELKAAMDEICPLIDLVIERNRATLLKVLIERSRTKSLDMAPLVNSLHEHTSSLLNLVLPDPPASAPNLPETQTTMTTTTTTNNNNSTKASRAHWTALCISILSHPDDLSDLLGTSILNLDDPTLFSLICQDTLSSRIIQAALTSCRDPIRKPLIQRFIPQVSQLAPTVAGSHVVEALLPATANLRFLRVRVGEELVAHRREIEETQPGRIVCVKWNVRAFRDRAGLWAGNKSMEQGEGKGKGEAKGKSGIEMARAKFAEEQRRKDKKKGMNGGRGANSILARAKVGV